MSSTGIDVRLFREVMGRFATGVCVVTASVDGHNHGATINSFTSVSLDPPLVLVSIDNRAKLHDYIVKAGGYGVSMLGVDQEDYSNHFAGRPRPDLEPDFEWLDGVPLLRGALAHVTTRLVAAHPAGDHTLFIGQVENMRPYGREPLLFFTGRYGRLDISSHEAPIGPYSVIAMSQFLDDDEVLL